MRYILYLFTMMLLFVAGMMVGNIYLPQRAASLASAVSVPELPKENPVLQSLTRERAEQNLDILNRALQSCPVVVNEEKDRLVNQIRLRLAIEDFELKKARLELEIAKNKENNRPTSQFAQASADYTQSRLQAQRLAEELFPAPPAEAVNTEPNAGQPASENASKPTAPEEEASVKK